MGTEHRSVLERHDYLSSVIALGVSDCVSGARISAEGGLQTWPLDAERRIQPHTSHGTITRHYFMRSSRLNCHTFLLVDRKIYFPLFAVR